MQKRIYNFEKIRGVDVTSSPINVASNRASRMVNIINEGGVNKKRHGWRDIAWFEDDEGNREPLNGIFKYTSDVWGEEIIVHAGTHFYRCGGDFEKYSIIGTAENKKSKGYVQDGKLWIVCGGDYLVYDGEKIQSVLDSEYAYIPTTTIGIKPGDSCQGERFQGVNLFQKRRRNKFIGQDTDYTKWFFDAPVKSNGYLSFTIEYYRTEGDKKKYTIIEAVWGEGGLTATAKDDEGKYVSGITEGLAEKVNVGGYSYGGKWYLEIRFPCPPIIEGESNITVEFDADYENDIEISSSAVVGLAPGADSLCLVNNGNIVYFSDILYGYGYFPDNDYIGIGAEDKAVTSLVTLGNGNIGVFKEDELYTVNIGVNYIDEDYVVRLEPSITSVVYGPGCANEYCALNVNGDSLIFNSLGVHGLTGSTEKPMNMRSTNVNRELCAYSNAYRINAHAVSHEGRYYLFIDGKVYIADTRFKTYESNRLDSGYEYEWWIWDNCKCRCAYSFDGKLIMGTENGEIREFSDGYIDERLIHAKSTSGDIVYDGQNFTFNQVLEIKDGERVQINSAFEKIDITITRVDYEEPWFITCYYESENPIPNVYIGMEVILRSENKKVYGTVLDCDYAKGKIIIRQDVGNKYDAEQEYELVKHPGSYIVDGGNLINEVGKVASFIDYNGIGAVIRRAENVSCELVTGAIDFYKLHSKTLYRLAITPSVDTSGAVQIGYETNLGKSDKARFIGEAFSFENFDFKNLVFDGAFSKTFIKRVFERNFNYITFRFASDSNGPFGIENAQAVYSINNELRSDR